MSGQEVDDEGLDGVHDRDDGIADCESNELLELGKKNREIERKTY